MSTSAEQPLPTYGLPGTAVRIDDTVRRAASEWSPTIHRLLTHVRAKGVDWVPEFRGFDDDGREILTFVDGEPGAPEGDARWDEELLTDIARRQRQWHDATADFPTEPDDVWFDPGRMPAEVIGHNTFADRSHVFKDGKFVGAIHFDHCYPTSRLWDLAYTAHFYIPVRPPTGDATAPFDVDTILARIDTFLTAYGEVEDQRGDTRMYSAADLSAILSARLNDMADRADVQVDPNLRERGSTYREHATWIESGALDRW